jgi:phosphonate transport system substrate-binding protein
MRLGPASLAAAVIISGAGACATFGAKDTKTSTASAALDAGPATADTATAPLPVAPTFDAPAGPAKPLITFGMSAPTGQELAQFSADELNAYLSDKLGGGVSTKLFDDANSLGDALAGGIIEAAWLTPPAYVRASSKGAIQSVARLSRGGATSYRSVIFVKASSKAKALTDVKGKKFVWIGKGSASSGLYPRLLLTKTGKEPDKFFKRVTEVVDHAAVCKAVLEGEAEVGATFADEVTGDASPIVDGCREAGYDATKFKIIAETDSIPNDVIAVRADVPPEVESHLQTALFDMAKSDKGKVQLKDIFHADGFGKSEDSDFQPVRAALKVVDPTADFTPFVPKPAPVAAPAAAPDAGPAAAASTAADAGPKTASAADAGPAPKTASVADGGAPAAAASADAGPAPKSASAADAGFAPVAAVASPDAGAVVPASAPAAKPK